MHLQFMRERMRNEGTCECKSVRAANKREQRERELCGESEVNVRNN